MLIDFHTHTTASDGALCPSGLLERARERGVQVLAITDHDTLRGFHEASTLVPPDVRLVSGVEISCTWSGVPIHVVGLNLDANDPGVRDIEQRLLRVRGERAERIASRLAERGMAGALEGARQIAGDAALCRPHFAQWMVEAGHVDTVNRAFAKWLGRGKPGDVKAAWPHLSDIVGIVRRAGGLAILAHPLKYGLTRTKLRALCEAFAGCGGSAIEVVNGLQSAEEVARLRRLARDFDLAASLGSDFHRDSPYGADLGVCPSLAGEVPSVLEQVL